MVKLLDPFTGYLLASGNNLLHFGYFIGILTLPSEETPCTAASYATARSLLIASHATVFSLQVAQYILTIKDMTNIAHILDYVAMIFYQGSILFT
jgi:hypothetical protein